MVTIRLILPYTGDISINRYLVKKKGGGFYIRETAALWRMVLRGALNSQMWMNFLPGDLDSNHPFDIKLTVNFPRRYGKRSGDAPNFDKFVRDSVALALEVDDAGTEGSQEGTYGNKEAANITVEITLYTRDVFLENELIELRLA